MDFVDVQTSPCNWDKDLASKFASSRIPLVVMIDMASVVVCICSSYIAIGT